MVICFLSLFCSSTCILRYPSHHHLELNLSSTVLPQHSSVSCVLRLPSFSVCNLIHIFIFTFQIDFCEVRGSRIAMFPKVFLTLIALLASTQAYGFPDGQLQPGCYSPPFLPEDSSTKPVHGRSKALWIHSRSWKGPRRSAKVWSGWAGVKYLFTLLVSSTW